MTHYHVASRIVWGIMICGLLAACATVSPDDTRQTPDERAITRRIQDMLAAYNARDIAAHIAAYTPEAEIESLMTGGAVISRDQFAQVLSELRDQFATAYLRSLAINVLSKQQAEATALIRVVGQEQDIIFRRDYQLERHAGEWLIAQERFVGSIPKLLQPDK
jgi:ketosteroid isomerase-like protein